MDYKRLLIALGLTLVQLFFITTIVILILALPYVGLPILAVGFILFSIFTAYKELG